jgi:hypothetical protein
VRVKAAHIHRTLMKLTPDDQSILTNFVFTILTFEHESFRYEKKIVTTLQWPSLMAKNLINIQMVVKISLVLYDWPLNT